MIYTASNGKNYDACNCMCHDDDMHVMHCMPCCSLCYEKYMSNGVIDREKVKAIVEARISKE